MRLSFCIAALLVAAVAAQSPPRTPGSAPPSDAAQQLPATPATTTTGASQQLPVTPATTTTGTSQQLPATPATTTTTGTSQQLPATPATTTTGTSQQLPATPATTTTTGASQQLPATPATTTTQWAVTPAPTKTGSPVSSGSGACTEVSVERDATYCIQGPVCSGAGATPAGDKCPKKGDVAKKDCHKALMSYADADQCVAPVDAQCVKIKTGAWGCVFSSAPSSAATPIGSSTPVTTPAPTTPTDASSPVATPASTKTMIPTTPGATPASTTPTGALSPVATPASTKTTIPATPGATPASTTTPVKSLSVGELTTSGSTSGVATGVAFASTSDGAADSGSSSSDAALYVGLGAGAAAAVAAVAAAAMFKRRQATNAVTDSSLLHHDISPGIYNGNVNTPV